MIDQVLGDFPDAITTLLAVVIVYRLK